MDKPKVTCDRKTETITVSLPIGWSFSRDFFYMLVDAIKQEAWHLSESENKDGIYLEEIADEIRKQVKSQDELEQKDIANIFG